MEEKTKNLIMEEKTNELLNTFSLGAWRKEHATSCVCEITKELQNIEQKYDLDLSERIKYWNDIMIKISQT